MLLRRKIRGGLGLIGRILRLANSHHDAEPAESDFHSDEERHVSVPLSDFLATHPSPRSYPHPTSQTATVQVDSCGGRLDGMKIVVATPLFPPDIAAPAPYVKELAKRLSQHEVRIVAYTHLPENVPGVQIIAISKRHPRITRLVLYAIALFRAVRSADVFLIENGASVEFPAIVVSIVTGKRFILHLGDTATRAHSKLRHVLSHLARKRARTVLTDSPSPRPEILPFEAMPEDAIAAYETSWEKHLAALTATFI